MKDKLDRESLTGVDTVYVEPEEDDISFDTPIPAPEGLREKLLEIQRRTGLSMREIIEAIVTQFNAGDYSDPYEKK